MPPPSVAHKDTFTFFPAWSSDVPEFIHNHTLSPGKTKASKENRLNALRQLRRIVWRGLMVDAMDKIEIWHQKCKSKKNQPKENKVMIERLEKPMKSFSTSPSMKVYALRQLKRVQDQVNVDFGVKSAVSTWKAAFAATAAKKYFKLKRATANAKQQATEQIEFLKKETKSREKAIEKEQKSIIKELREEIEQI